VTDKKKNNFAALKLKIYQKKAENK